MRPVSFNLTNIFPSCDHAELMFGALYSEKIDTLESRIFDLELSNDKLKQENEIMKNHISRQEDCMDGLEDGLNLCFQEKNDLEQYTRKSSIRITGLDDHDKDENIEESIKTVHKFLTKTIKMEINTKPNLIKKILRLFWFEPEVTKRF
jgi:predicted RNase H-like nuclease (RuvC/YqgF family)